ncbi:uncharacterized protein LOC128955730 [Oppia nitens]|uniref:uncharacterized protein LOC128955730 n=1 Tax=Oppia nitens TaxID=1686743 RepID=UPI0023DC144A|nr:uncharacterized protein LOC128955730 [Oppia nitens]
MTDRLFETKKHADLYAKYRSNVPTVIIDKILDYLGQQIDKNEWDTVVDVGCGSGQGTNGIAPHFKHCYGFDVSAAQIKVAKESQHPDNVKYEVCPAENLPSIVSNSVQLVTAFEAVHWFDFDNFMAEVSRVLVINGVVALVGYFIPDTIDPDKPDDNRITQLYTDLYLDDRIQPFKNPKLSSLENSYRNFKFPQNYEFLRIDSISTEKTELAIDIVKGIESASHIQALAAKHPITAQTIIQELTEKLQQILQTDDLSTKQLLDITHYFVVLARKLND